MTSEPLSNLRELMRGIDGDPRDARFRGSRSLADMIKPTEARSKPNEIKAKLLVLLDSNR